MKGRLAESAPARNEAVRKELEVIRKLDPRKELRPEAIVDYAKRNKTSALGKLYPRDDSDAAYQYRLEWARAVIRVHVTIVTDPKTRINVGVEVKEYQSLSDRRGKEGGYLPTTVVLEDADRRHRLLLDTIARLASIKEVNLFPEELGDVIRTIAKVRDRFPEPEEESEAA